MTSGPHLTSVFVLILAVKRRKRKMGIYNLVPKKKAKALKQQVHYLCLYFYSSDLRPTHRQSAIKKCVQIIFLDNLQIEQGKKQRDEGWGLRCILGSPSSLGLLQLI